MLRLKLPDYLADYHIWTSLLRCPHPHPFTHTQRLCVSLLLLLGYAAANTTIISQMEDQVGQIQLRLLVPVCVTDHSLCFAVAIWCGRDWCVCSFHEDRSGKRTAGAARCGFHILPVSTSWDQAHGLRHPTEEWPFWRWVHDGAPEKVWFLLSAVVF